MSWNAKRHNEVSGKLIRLLTALNSPSQCGEGCEAHFGGHQASQRLKLSFQFCQRDGRLVTLPLNKCLQCFCDELVLVFCKQTLHRNLWSASGRYQCIQLATDTIVLTSCVTEWRRPLYGMFALNLSTISANDFFGGGCWMKRRWLDSI